MTFHDTGRRPVQPVSFLASDWTGEDGAIQVPSNAVALTILPAPESESRTEKINKDREANRALAQSIRATGASEMWVTLRQW